MLIDLQPDRGHVETPIGRQAQAEVTSARQR